MNLHPSAPRISSIVQLPTGPDEVQRVFDDLVITLKALADQTRVRVVSVLAGVAPDPLSVTEVGDRVGITQPAASVHLKVLHESGLVDRKRQNAQVLNILLTSRLLELADVLNELAKAATEASHRWAKSRKA